MAVVAGVLLDHVDQDPPQRHRAARPPLPPLELVERRRRLDDRSRRIALGLPGREVGGHVGLVDVVEVAVGVLVGPVVRRRHLAPEAAPEPGALDIGHVADQAQERERRGRHRPAAGAARRRSPSHFNASVARWYSSHANEHRPLRSGVRWVDTVGHRCTSRPDRVHPDGRAVIRVRLLRRNGRHHHPSAGVIMSNLSTAQAIYEAFGPGDIPFILDLLADDVAWESWEDNSAQKAGVDHLAARHGQGRRGGVLRLVGSLGDHRLPGARPARRRRPRRRPRS